MGDSIQYGISQLSLLVFTTLAPSAAVAFILVGIAALFGKRGEEERIRLAHFLIVPTAIFLYGLIVSTSHLGKPSNSLYVLTEIGQSPLSNEVAAAVVFAGMAWLFCMLSFSRRAVKTPLWIFLGLTCVAAVVHIWFTAGAYEIRTVVTWYTPLTIFIQFLQAIAGGCLIAITTFIAAGWRKEKTRFVGLLIAALVASALTAVAQFVLVGQMGSLWSALVSAADYVPFYPTLVVGSLVLCAVAAAAQLIAVLKQPLPSLPVAIACTIFMLAGIAVARFGFYCAHLTAGI